MSDNPNFDQAMRYLNEVEDELKEGYTAAQTSYKVERAQVEATLALVQELRYVRATLNESRG